MPVSEGVSRTGLTRDTPQLSEIAMLPRERLIATLEHRRPDKVPKDAWFTPATLRAVEEHTGAKEPAQHYGFEHRCVDFAPTQVPRDFSSYLPPDLPPGTTVDEWGTAYIPSDHHHFRRYVWPLASLRDPTAADAHDYPWPDVEAEYRHDHLDARVTELRGEGLFVVGTVGHMGWEKACYLRGIPDMCADLYENPEFASALLDKLCELECFMARRFAEAGVDMVWLSGDVGMQDKLMISPRHFRQWVKPRLRRVIGAARRVSPGIFVGLHQCGYVEPLIRDFVEVGVDVLHPIQPESMDPFRLKREWGDVLTLWGTVGAQSVLPFGRPQQVREVVKRNIEGLGRGGGLWIAPSQALLPDVPWENIEAFFRAVEEFG